MIKMKQIMEGFSYKRKFGEKLPTLKDFAKDTTEKSVTEAVTPRAYSEIRGQARYLAMEIKNLNKGIKSQSDKNVIDSYGTHWLQYAAFALSAFAIFTTWAFFFDYKFHNFVLNILRVIDCSGFNCNGVY